MRYGIINAHMLGATSEPGEYVDWSTHDVRDEHEAEFLLGDVAAYAAGNPHMIIFVIDEEV